VVKIILIKVIKLIMTNRFGVHGVWTTERDLLENSVENADEIFERLNMSIKDAGYNYPVVGFSWDSDTTIDIEGEGWNIVVGIQILL
jgi:hypothetical protein